MWSRARTASRAVALPAARGEPPCASPRWLSSASASSSTRSARIESHTFVMANRWHPKIPWPTAADPTAPVARHASRGRDTASQAAFPRPTHEVYTGEALDLCRVIAADPGKTIYPLASPAGSLLAASETRESRQRRWMASQRPQIRGDPWVGCPQPRGLRSRQGSIAREE